MGSGDHKGCKQSTTVSMLTAETKREKYVGQTEKKNVDANVKENRSSLKLLALLKMWDKANSMIYEKLGRNQRHRRSQDQVLDMDTNHTAA